MSNLRRVSFYWSFGFRCFLFLALAVWWKICWASTGSDLRCGGIVERRVWEEWRTGARLFVQELIEQRLTMRGDTYALYDFQTYTHNLVAMARRCGRLDRLREIGAVVKEAYGSLESGANASDGRLWVCRGGAVCTARNRLLNTEVQLYSVQFLGLATSVANALATSRGSLSRSDEEFIADTTGIAIEHLLRWGSESVIQSMQGRANDVPADVEDGSSRLFFTDKPLWQIAIYAELGGIFGAMSERGRPLALSSTGAVSRMRRHYGALMKFFWARVSMWSLPRGSAVTGSAADLDRGFWRLYPDNRYAAYTELDKPVRCAATSTGSVTPITLVAPESVPVVPEGGWDISHARRLVHALDALYRNQDAVSRMWGSADFGIPATTLTKAFANNLLANVWNGDPEFPLFANYWSGANGWYRVAWDNGTGQCREGTPPFGLTDSFATGGYATWAHYAPGIGRLALRLYALGESDKPDEVAFVKRYYPDLAKAAKGKAAVLGRLMFWPSLVAVAP